MPVQGSAAKSRPAEEAPAPPVDDDPFSVDKSVAANAIPVSRQSTGGKTLEVTCPMCETTGFISPKSAGKQVKCCNPQCMVPIFTAPVIEKQERVVAPPPPKKTLPWLYLVGGVAAVAIAAVCIVVMQDQGPTEIAPPPLPVYGTTNTGDNKAAGDGNEKPGDKTNGPDQTEGPKSADQARQDLIKRSLQRMIEVSFNIPDNYRPLWRRLAATAHIHNSDVKAGREQVRLIVAAQGKWEAILPLVDLAWRKSKAPDEFKQTVDEAYQLALKLPTRGRYSTEAAIATAPLLIVSGKSNEARQLLAEHHSPPHVDQLAAALQVVLQEESFNLDSALPGRTLGDWQAPLETAVTLILAARGRWDDAQAWATQATDPVVKAETTTVWAESYLRRAVPAGDAAGLEKASATAKGLSPEGQARFWARLAAVKLAGGERPAAEQLLGQAEKILAQIPVPAPVKVQGNKPLLDQKLPPATPLKQASLAATEIAGVQAQLGRTDVAWNTVLSGLGYLRAIGPSESATRERRRRVDNETDKVRAELKRETGVKGDDELRRLFNNYREKLLDVEKATAVRFSGEAVVLEAATNFGLLNQVWGELQNIDRKPDINEREPFLALPVCLLVAARFEDAGNGKMRDEITAAVQGKVDLADPDAIRFTAERLLNKGDLAGAIEQLNSGVTHTGILHLVTLRSACRLVSGGKITEAASFCGRIKDPNLRQDSVFLVAALAAKAGAGEAITKAFAGVNLATIETTCLSSGLVVGINSPPPANPPPGNPPTGK